MCYDDDKNVEIAMQIILESGEAKKLVATALTDVENFDFEGAKKHIAEAKQFIIKAHEAQTDTIRAEIAGESKIEPVLLFNHAQDTLMTIMSEVRTIEKLIQVFEKFYNHFNK